MNRTAPSSASIKPLLEVSEIFDKLRTSLKIFLGCVRNGDPPIVLVSQGLGTVSGSRGLSMAEGPVEHAMSETIQYILYCT
jgi:hypothetical protein